MGAMLVLVKKLSKHGLCPSAFMDFGCWKSHKCLKYTSSPPGKTNMSPEKWSLEDSFPFEMAPLFGGDIP